MAKKEALNYIFIFSLNAEDWDKSFCSSVRSLEYLKKKIETSRGIRKLLFISGGFTVRVSEPQYFVIEFCTKVHLKVVVEKFSRIIDDRVIRDIKFQYIVINIDKQTLKSNFFGKEYSYFVKNLENKKLELFQDSNKLYKTKILKNHINKILNIKEKICVMRSLKYGHFRNRVIKRLSKKANVCIGKHEGENYEIETIWIRN